MGSGGLGLLSLDCRSLLLLLLLLSRLNLGDLGGCVMGEKWVILLRLKGGHGQRIAGTGCRYQWISIDGGVVGLCLCLSHLCQLNLLDLLLLLLLVLLLLLHRHGCGGSLLLLLVLLLLVVLDSSQQAGGCGQLR